MNQLERNVHVVNVVYFSLPPISRVALVSRFTQNAARSPCLAHKAPVMQVNFISRANAQDLNENCRGYHVTSVLNENC